MDRLRPGEATIIHGEKGRMEADADAAGPPRFAGMPLVSGYLVLWAVIMAVLGGLLVAGQLRQAREAFSGDAAAIHREIDTRLRANEFVLNAAAAFAGVVGPDDSDALAAFASQVLRDFPHIHLIELQQRVTPGALDALVQRLHGEGRYGFQLRGGPPGAAEYFPVVASVPPREGSGGRLGWDVRGDPIAWPAAREALSSGRAVATRFFPWAEDGGFAYVLFRSVRPPLAERGDVLLASLLVRAPDLLPDRRSLPPGFQVRLQHGLSASAEDQSVLFDTAAGTGAAVRWVFPRLSSVRIFGSDAQPFVLSVSQQLGGWMLDPLLTASYVVTAGLSLLAALGLARGRLRREAERRAAERRLYYLANFDSLTALPNRNLLGDRLQQALSRARRYQSAVAVMFLDLDGFKAVNDSAGHAAGDRLLQMVADRLTAVVRAQDTVARLSGDEFVVVLEDVKGRDDAERVTAQLRDAFVAPFSIGSFDFMVTASIGLALYPEDGGDGASLLRRADERMYALKHPEWAAPANRRRPDRRWEGDPSVLGKH